MRQSFKSLAAALALLLVGCTGASEHVAQGAAAIAGSVWLAEEIAGAAVTGDMPITLRFDADGGASGRGGCNSYGGSYTLTGDALSFGPIAATRMACEPALMDQEQRYFDTLAKVTRYAVADDGALLLTTGEGKEIRFRRE
jgi:heat shock protein HslJ